MNQLTSAKMLLDDELQALLLLSSLPDSWDTLVVSLSNSAPKGKLTMECVKASLLNEETRRKEMGVSSQSEANVTQGSGNNRGRSKQRQQQNRDKSKGRSKSRSKYICYYCEKPGHIQKYCRKFKRDKGKEPEKSETSRNQEDKDTATLTISDEIVELFVVADEGSLNLASDECTWIVDSAASYHITPHKEYFSSYTCGDFGRVKMGNDGVSNVVGMGTICLLTSTGCNLILRNVRHVPDIRLNLISSGILDDDGYAQNAQGGVWKCSKGNLIVARAKKQNIMYVILVRDECYWQFRPFPNSNNILTQSSNQ